MRCRLFADAKFRKNNIQQILDIDPAGNPSQGITGPPKVLRLDVQITALCRRLQRG